MKQYQQVEYFNTIDTYRFLSALGVCISHWYHYIPFINQTKLGFAGVDFFFLISGFLISIQLFKLKEKIKQDRLSTTDALKNFYIKRFFRIVPSYYLITILATIFNDNEIREAFIYNISFTSNYYFISTQKWSAIFSHFWSLSVEMHFYFFWPILFLLIRVKYLNYISVLFILISILYRYYTFTNSFDYFDVYINSVSCMDLFMFGFLLAYFYYSQKKWLIELLNNKTFKVFVLSGFVLTFISISLIKESPVYTWVFFRSIWGILGILLIGISLSEPKGFSKLILENKIIIFLGKLSYSIYLVHNFVPGILLELKKYNIPLYLEFLLYFSFTTFVSYLIYKLIETPVRNYGIQLTTRN